MTEQNTDDKVIQNMKETIQKLLSDFEEFSKKLNLEQEEKENGNRC
ncbi:MAG: hypothetical protein M1416_02780 [Candidatus Pacearchaeota archaeon]|nr:hypothetical protein [Candidatus Pacearchaeota archaeon]